ncbi:hypothetical protein RhiirC2_800841, partial [Rhizophagus irregularis]
MYTNFSPCILIDYLDNKLQTCGQTKNVRNLCQLVEVWQIDENAVSEYQSKGIPLGVYWTDDKWKEIGEKLGNEVWNSRKIVTDKKSEIQYQFLLMHVEHITKCVKFFASLVISMAFPYLGVWFTQVMAKKQRMDKVNPTERLIKGPNIWNLAVINNIDFKEKSFTYGNIFDTTRKSFHTMLRMAFQMRMPIPLEERANDKKNITSPTGLFGMNDLMKDTWD